MEEQIKTEQQRFKDCYEGEDKVSYLKVRVGNNGTGLNISWVSKGKKQDIYIPHQGIMNAVQQMDYCKKKFSICNGKEGLNFYGEKIK